MIGNMQLELNKAKANNYAIPAVNAISPLMIKKYVAVADSVQAPIIVSLAEAHLGYMGLAEAVHAWEYYATQTNVPVMLHLDHGQTMEVVKRAIDLGFPSIMIDGSSHDFATNVEMTRTIVDYAKGKNVAVEGEIGHVGAGSNYETDLRTTSIYTTVKEAVEFLQQTKVDSLAISIGTVHGHYQGTPNLNFERLLEIKNSVDVPLVLHGGSSSGDDNLEKAIELGISKINIFTDIVTSINRQLDGTFDYFEVLKQIDAGITACLTHYFNLFGTTKWGKVK